MGTDPNLPCEGARPGWLRPGIIAAGLCGASLGTVALARWVLQLHTPLLPWSQAMPNAALGLLLDGLAVFAIAWGRGRLALPGASWSLLLGTATLAEYLFSVDLRIDQLLIRDHLGRSAFPGRIGPNVAFCFVLTGIVLWWASARRKRWEWIGVMCLLSAVVFAAGGVSMLGGLAGAPSHAGWSSVLPRIGALDTAIGFALLGLGLLLVVRWRDSEQSVGFSSWLVVGVAAGGLTVALCFGQALSGLNVDRIADVARDAGWRPEQVLAVVNAVQGNQPLMLGSIGFLVTLLMILMAHQTLASRRQANESLIAASKLAQETAERQRVQASLDRFFKLGVDPLCIQSYEGWFKRINPAWGELLGYSTDELMTRPFIGFVDPEDREATLLACARAMEGQRVIEFENRCVCKDGSIRWLLWNLVGSGAAREIYGVARDNTARKKAQADLLELQWRLEQKVSERTAELTAVNKELEAFTYSVSHDLRAPLRRIEGFTQILAEQLGAEAGEEIMTAIRRIRSGTHQMAQLMNDLLSLSRITRQELRSRTIDLQSVLDEVMEDLATETSGRDIEWRLGRLPPVDCDPALVKQVFWNLLSNAVKFTQPRQRAIIEVSSAEVDGERVIMIRDNGVGFNMKYASKLFAPFERLHRQDEFPGTGVGLTTVQRIIDKHGGRIWAESELDRGAAFYFTLGEKQAAEKSKAVEENVLEAVAQHAE